MYLKKQKKSSSNEPKIIDLLILLWGLFERRRKDQYLFLVGLIFFSSILEIISIGSLMPLLSSILNPEMVYNKFVANNFMAGFIQNSPQSIMVSMGFLFGVLAILSGLAKVLVIWATSKIAFSSGADLTLLIYKNSLNMPYANYALLKSADIIDAISTKVNTTINSAIIPTLYLINSLLMISVITIGLLFIDYKTVLFFIITYSTIYMLLLKKTKTRMSLTSNIMAKNSSELVKLTQVGLGGIRDITIDRSQSAFIRLFKSRNDSLRMAQGNTVFIANSPKFLLETSALVMVALVVIVKAFEGAELTLIAPVLGLIALCAQKLLPLMQQIFSTMNSYRESIFALDEVVKRSKLISNNLIYSKDIFFKKSISIINLSYKYPAKNNFVLQNINFHITKGSKFGIVGKTGSGKSTLVDILLGLIKPDSGSILIDGKNTILFNNESWFNKISHVPQDIFLTDGDVNENIAFGVPYDEINFEKVIEAAKSACVHEFVTCMEDQYKTRLGERGVSISGGEKQRIGIARALYKNPQILFLDEATSALDSETEKSIMKSIVALDKDLTVISIAHRVNALKNFDYVLNLND
jgi:ABC-type multidrug transport system fused ATPase/permease subunit